MATSHPAALLRTPVDTSVFNGVWMQRLRRTFGYLAFLALVTSLTLAGRTALNVRDLVERLLPIVDKIPTITMRNGEASTNVPQPWVKRLGEDHGKDVVLIIDTTGRRADFLDSECGLFLQKRVLLVKGADGAQRSLSLARVPDGEIGPTILKHYLARARWLVPLVVAALAFVWLIFAKTMQALLLVLVALMATSRRRKPLRFAELFTVGAYGLGPAVLADCVTWFYPLPWFLLIYAALAIAYTVIGARRIPDEPQLTLVL